MEVNNKIISINSIDDIINMFSGDLLEFLTDILNNKYVSEIKIEDFSQDLIMLSCFLAINLPCRKSTMKVKINEKEPIILGISKNCIKYKAPYIFSARKDFPINNLPHCNTIYKYFKGICIYRGNINDWYVEHSVSEFIDRIRNWFSDAATSRLIKKGDEFEPMAVNEPSDKIIYSYDKVINYIKDYWRCNQGEKGHAFLVYKYKKLETNENLFSLEVTSIFEKRYIKKKLNEITTAENTYIGILTWGEEKSQYKEYIELSDYSLKEIKKISSEVSNEFDRALNVLKNKRIEQEHLLIIMAINRPNNIIGFNDKIELLNIVSLLQKKIECGVETYDDNMGTLPLKHYETFNSHIALKLSNKTKYDCEKKLLIIGAGALGSKVIMHLARQGFNQVTIVDNDKLYPHNLARHNLFSDSVGKNKAKEMVEILEQIYKYDENKKFEYIDESFIEFANENDLKQYDVILDFTTSKAVLMYLSENKEKLSELIIRAEMAYHGKLAFILVGGCAKEALSLLDLQMSLYTHSEDINEVSNWLNEYNKLRLQGDSELEEVSIGLGCNTSTMKLADDIISYHAALISNYIIKLFNNKKNADSISVSYFSDVDYNDNYFKTYEVEQYKEIHSESGWNVKIKGSLYTEMIKKLEESRPNETGGILIGILDYRRKMIYVLNSYTPSDSKGYPYEFTKGSEGTINYLQKIKEKSGDIFRYVGEWHTHPEGSVYMSLQDKESLKQLKEELGEYPAHVMILNGKDVSSNII